MANDEGNLMAWARSVTRRAKAMERVTFETAKDKGILLKLLESEDTEVADALISRAATLKRIPQMMNGKHKEIIQAASALSDEDAFSILKHLWVCSCIEIEQVPMDTETQKDVWFDWFQFMFYKHPEDREKLLAQLEVFKGKVDDEMKKRIEEDIVQRIDPISVSDSEN